MSVVVGAVILIMVLASGTYVTAIIPDGGRGDAGDVRAGRANVLAYLNVSYVAPMGGLDGRATLVVDVMALKMAEVTSSTTSRSEFGAFENNTIFIENQQSPERVVSVTSQSDVPAHVMAFSSSLTPEELASRGDFTPSTWGLIDYAPLTLEYSPQIRHFSGLSAPLEAKSVGIHVPHPMEDRVVMYVYDVGKGWWFQGVLGEGTQMTVTRIDKAWGYSWMDEDVQRYAASVNAMTLLQDHRVVVNYAHNKGATESSGV